MRVNKRMKKVFSILLCLCMVPQYVSTTAFAVTTDNLCDHHTEHTAECGYAEGVSDCTYHCDVCQGHDHGDEVTEKVTDPAPVCNCGTDDASIHATTCAVYVAPENPICYCEVKCTEANVWCDICGVDYTACGGQGEAVPFLELAVCQVYQ